MKKVFLFLMLALSTTTITLNAQPIYNQDGIQLLHTPSLEEIELSKTIIPIVERTAPPVGQIRPIAEWEPMEAVLIRYSFGIPMSLIKEMANDIKVITIVANSSQQTTVTNQYITNGVNMANCDFLIAPNDSYWTRDYGPWFMAIDDSEIAMFDFYYNRPIRPNDNQINTYLATKLGLTRYSSPLWLTGGNYMNDGINQAFSTTLTITENSSYSTQYIRSHFEEYLGIETFHFIQDPIVPYDNIQHIDCWSKLLSPNKVLVAQVPTNHRQYAQFEAAANYFANQTSSWGTPFEVYRVNAPGATYNSPITPYTNSLILNNKVFVPVNSTLTTNDIAALAVYADAMPGYQIIPINYGSWINTDALHCRTHEIADKHMIHISHYPNFEPHDFSFTYDLSAKIVAYSGQNFYQDSLRIYYRINDGEWDFSLLTPQGNNMFTGTVTTSIDALKLDYYFYAADYSGRGQSYPMVGEYDPFSFEILEYNPYLTLSDTEFVFEIEDNVLEKILTISNLTNNPITIESINNETMEYSLVTPYPYTEVYDYPLILLPNETIEFEISPLLLSKNSDRSSDYNVDILKITTSFSVYHVVIKCSKQFLLEDDPVLTLSDTVFVFEFDDENLEQILTVSNLTNTTVTIESINNETMEYSLVEPYPNTEVFVYPMVLLPNETIEFEISPLMLSKNSDRSSDYNVDILKITTPETIYQVVIKCSKEFLLEDEPVLTLSDTEFVFEIDDIVLEKILTISNLTTVPVAIESINNETMEYSVVTPYPDGEVFVYPMILLPNESIEFEISPLMLSKNSGRNYDYNVDILKITTPETIYQVVIKCSKEFLLEDEPVLTLSDTEFIFEIDDIVLEKILTISNLTTVPVAIESINNETMEYSVVTPYPDGEVFVYPMILLPNETIEFEISPLMLSKNSDRNSDYNIDILKITTPETVYHVLIKCSKQFLLDDPVLTLSDTEFIFEFDDDELEKILTVSNLTNTIVFIESVNNETMEYSLVTPFPETEVYDFPMVLLPNETIEFEISPLMLSKNGSRNSDYNVDILQITTPDFVYDVLIKCSVDFLLEDDPVLTLSDTEFVFEIDDEVLNKILTVSNLTNTTVTIGSVNNEAMEYSLVTPYPETEVYDFPMVLLPNETIEFEISPLMLDKNSSRNSEYNIDILQITTPDFVYDVLIKCSVDFLLEDDPVLTLSDTEYIFEMDDEVLNKILTVSNLTNTTVTIESVNNETMEYSLVTPYPETEVYDFPMVLLPNETIEFEISPLMLDKNNQRNSEYNIDILQITTPDFVYDVLIKCSVEFLNNITISEIESITIVPNPTSGKFSVISFQFSDVSIEIFDVTGRVVHREPFAVNREPIEIDISHLPAGIYFVHIQTNNNLIVRKIVVSD
ncbi:MAG: agmatine deiminase family protein [Marinilabiliaceae bacterium]|nr:agmatine deiminase family protein [Marinilabiliaceae bacterium]